MCRFRGTLWVNLDNDLWFLIATQCTCVTFNAALCNQMKCSSATMDHHAEGGYSSLLIRIRVDFILNPFILQVSEEVSSPGCISLCGGARSYPSEIALVPRYQKRISKCGPVQ
jgi:hypothetical protein